MSVDLNEILQHHMEDQPYRATCGECGEDIELDVVVDSDYDLDITVPVCKCARKD